MKNNKALSIVGASRNNGDREENDFYVTPTWCVEELLKRETFEGGIWEPCCGNGAISEVLKSHGYYVFSSDLIDRGYGDVCDFFDRELPYPNIITNPPYKGAIKFVEHAKLNATNKIAMFLKTVFLESEERYEMFQDKEFGLKTMYQFSKRPTLYKNGITMKATGMIAYAWFVWEKGYSGKPTIEWIK